LLLDNLAGRVGGRFTFRLVGQPTVAAFLAIRAGLKDAREGRVPYGWVVLSDSASRQDLLREGWKDAAKVFSTAVVIDLVYQITELQWFYPEEAVIVAVTCFAALSAAQGAREPNRSTLGPRRRGIPLKRPSGAHGGVGP